MNKRIPVLIVACIMGLLVTACERQKIGDITADPGRYEGKDVSVAGRVTGMSFGALNTGLYQVDDGTGKIYVIAESRGVPSEGAYVGVKGRVVPTFTFMGRNYATVLRESDRKAVRPPK